MLWLLPRKDHLMTPSLPLIGVTGSTGQLGGRVAARLATLNRPQRLLVRDPARAPQLPGTQVVQTSYEDGPSMRAALYGVQTLFLVSGWGPSRLEAPLQRHRCGCRCRGRAHRLHLFPVRCPAGHLHACPRAPPDRATAPCQREALYLPAPEFLPGESPPVVFRRGRRPRPCWQRHHHLDLAR